MAHMPGRTQVDTNTLAQARGDAILDMRVDTLSPAQAAATIHGWAAACHEAPDPDTASRDAAQGANALGDAAQRAAHSHRDARMVCAANVHMTMEAHDDLSFRAVVNSADLVLPDGMPLVWGLRLLGRKDAERVRMTPDLVLELLRRAADSGLAVGLYGGTDGSLAEMRRRLTATIPSLHIAYALAPPFRPLTEEEDHTVVHAIRDARVDLLLVGIGCPKQERWMADHRAELPCVMVGVGAAFDLLAGRTREAPRWMQRSGLEWVHRLSQDPRRLWRRYARHNPRFVALFLAELLRRRR